MLVHHGGVLLQYYGISIQHGGISIQHGGISIQHDPELAEECLTLEVIIKRYTNLSWCAKTLIFFGYPI
jgi:hypothetical protein